MFSSLNPIFDANAKTAAICVPPANITLDTLDAELNIPATKGIIGSPIFATILYGCSESILSSADVTIWFFNSTGLSGMLELTFALKSNAFSNANAVVVPPGIHSPIIKQSVNDAKLLPRICPYSTAWDTIVSFIASSTEIFFPKGKPDSIKGNCGMILLPAFIVKWEILADSRAVLVNNPGVGFPSGVIGILSIVLQYP